MITMGIGPNPNNYTNNDYKKLMIIKMKIKNNKKK